MELLDIIMEFLRSLLYMPYNGVFMEFGNSHTKFATTMWSVQGVSLPDSRVFLFNFNTIKWNSSGVLLVCKEY